MKYYCVESTWEYEHQGYLFRVWRNENGERFTWGEWTDVKDTIDSLFGIRGIQPIMDNIASLPHINAVQVIHLQTKQGAMIYVVPF